MQYFAGIDIGSTSIKVVIIDQSGKMVKSIATATGSSFNQNAVDALNGLLAEAAIGQNDLAYTVSTGYGRKLFKTGNETVNEITANAAGVRALGSKFNTVRTIINVGGQDSKVIRLKQGGSVENFAMNDKCAAGTGRFLEIAARNLEVDIADFADLHLNSLEPPCQVNSTCAVFAESELISLLAAGHEKGTIAAGVHHSIAQRLGRLATRVGVAEDVLFDGGTALNAGMQQALEDELMLPLVKASNPQITTALGGANLARDKYLQLYLNENKIVTINEPDELARQTPQVFN